MHGNGADGDSNGPIDSACARPNRPDIVQNSACGRHDAKPSYLDNARAAAIAKF